MKLINENVIADLKDQYELSLWSKVSSDETIFMIESNNKYVGYIAYSSNTTTLTKIEVFKPYRGQGLGRRAMVLFLKTIKPYTDRIYIKPITDELFVWYEQFGFKRCVMQQWKMKVKI